MAVVLGMLRGVNVGGNRKLPMERLRAICEQLGFGGPQTFIQSGNVIFETDEPPGASLSSRLEAGIANEFGFRPPVVLRGTAELERVVAGNPFAGKQNVDFSKLLVIFLQSDPGEGVRTALGAFPVAPEELVATGSEIYLYFQEGMGKTKVSFPKMERIQGTPGTGRNWNTVLKLLAMMKVREV